MKKTTALLQLFNRNKIFVLAGGGCPMHAKIAQAAGFEAAYMSGANTAAWIYGLPDAGIITMDEMVRNAQYMANSIDIPLLCDSDQGFGNAINVRRTVQAFIRAGAAGIHIEDQVAPKRCGFVKGKEVIPLDEAVGKYRSAVDAKNELDPDFVIISRCDARGSAGGTIEDVIVRLKAYKEAGVDVLYFEGPQSLEELLQVREAVEGPLISTLGFIDPAPTVEAMGNLGLAAAFFPGLIASPGLAASWDFAHDFMERGVEALNERSTLYKNHPMSNFGMFDLMDFPKIREWEERYLPKELVETKYATSSGLYDPGEANRLA